MHIVAHRGAEDLHLENSMAAFQAAAPADAFELDIHATFDNHLVVMHDRTAARVASPESPYRDQPLASLTLEQVKEITLIDGSQVPTLEEVLAATKLPIQVEIKAAGAVPTLQTLLASRPSELERLLFICFMDPALEELADRIPAARLGFLREHGFGDLSIIDRVPARNLAALLPNWKGLELATISELHARDIKVGCWTIRDEHSFAIAQQAGVDFATVSDPTRFLNPGKPGALHW
ncbi:glycerophosphodiester phosphodiesterase [Corynebacterium callunae]|uniref:glycerophosphodiester phosphodiesterase n=1 Tax=Corynebacterium callunae TaxID=1721 RepID=UPI00398255BE